ncbi:MAG: hypothetical protein K2H91_09340 [Lachnospiraceae bacterium]|nr:hypothetical protein [Lachnospiraceae bacterium]
MLERVFEIIDEQGMIGLIKTIYKRTLPFRNKIKWSLCSNKKGWLGITDKKRKVKIIVSLTSFPARINIVDITIKSLLMQSLKPDEIILWLAKEQFPGKENGLPDKVLELKKHGLTINWCDDIKSYKKLIPALRMYPEDIIVTADDDVYYERHWLKRLYLGYLKAPDYVHCHRISKFYIKDNEYKMKKGEFEVYPFPSYLHKLTGVGGVLYPPHILYQEVLDEEKFRKFAPTNDDIWFWLMAVLNDAKINVVKNNIPRIEAVKGTQEGECLNKINDCGDELLWKDFYRMLRAYPQLDDILRNEYKIIQNML